MPDAKSLVCAPEAVDVLGTDSRDVELPLDKMNQLRRECHRNGTLATFRLRNPALPYFEPLIDSV